MTYARRSLSHSHIDRKTPVHGRQDKPKLRLQASARCPYFFGSKRRAKRAGLARMTIGAKAAGSLNPRAIPRTDQPRLPCPSKAIRQPVQRLSTCKRKIERDTAEDHSRRPQQKTKSLLRRLKPCAIRRASQPIWNTINGATCEST